MARGEERGNEPNNQDDRQERQAGSIIPVEQIQNRILLIRGQKVILDSDLAGLYGVETRVLVQAMKRNRVRFPSDFVFQLTKEEFQVLRSQAVISNMPSGRGGRRYPPYVFTEHGAIMAASVLNSPQAVQTSVFVGGPSSACARCSPRIRTSPSDSNAWKTRSAPTTSRSSPSWTLSIYLMPPEEEPLREPFGFRRAKKD
jgi:hypothetical protein